MGKFFKSSEYKTNSKMKDTLRTFNDYISHGETYNYFETYEKIINNFLDGKRVFERPFGYVQTENKSLYKFPGYSGDLETDFKNITDYLSNLDECFNELKDDEIGFGTIRHSYQNHKYFKRENGKLEFDKSLLNDIYDRKLNFDQVDNTAKLDNYSNESNVDLYNVFTTFKQTHTMREKREKPKWYEFRKRYRNWKEEKALNKVEKLLKDKGLKDEIINNAKAGISITKETFNKSFHLNESNLTDSLNKMVDEYKNKVDINSNDYKKKDNIISFLNILSEYKRLEEVHNTKFTGIENYNKEEQLLKEGRIKISELMKFNTTQNQRLYNSIFHKSFYEMDINVIRENIYNANDKEIDCYEKLVHDIDEVSDDINFTDENGKLMNLDDELFEQVKNDVSKDEIEEDEIDIVNEKMKDFL